MIYLTIFNTIAIIVIFFLLGIHKKFSIEVKTTFFDKTKVGIQFYFNNRGFMYIPLRNRRKIELHEEVCRLIAGSEQNRIYTLNAKFSWVKTDRELYEFEKDYSTVDRKIVEMLVSNFKNKNHGTQ